MALIAFWSFQRLGRRKLLEAARITWLNLLVDCSVQSNSSKFSLESDAGGVEWRGCNGIKRSAALGIGVVVVILSELVSKK